VTYVLLTRCLGGQHVRIYPAATMEQIVLGLAAIGTAKQA